MSIDPLAFRICVASLSKTAGFLDQVGRAGRSAAGHVGDAVRWGWHGMDPAKAEAASSGWRWSKGRIGRYLPGPKTQTLMFGALAAPALLRDQDPSGQERGRGERVADFLGQTVGGLAGSGAVMRAMQGRSPYLQMIPGMAAGMAGAHIGGRLARAPFSLARKLRQPARVSGDPALEQGRQDESWHNQAPYGMHSPDAREGQVAQL